MSSTLREAAQQALEALEKVKTDADKQPPVYPWDIWRMWVDRAITTIRAALAEPPGSMPQHERLKQMKAQRKAMSDLTIADIYVKWDATPGASMADFARAIERAHGIK